MDTLRNEEQLVTAPIEGGAELSNHGSVNGRCCWEWRRYSQGRIVTSDVEDFDFAAQRIVSKDEFFLAFVPFKNFGVELGERGKVDLVVADLACVG